MRIANQSYEMVPVSVLKTHPRNPRRGDVGIIADSVRENGFFGVVVVQQTTGFILAGNHRFLAAVQEGASEVPVVYVDCTDDEALRILLADNRTADIAYYDDAALGALLAEMAGTERGLAGSGYTKGDIDALLSTFEEQSHEGSGAAAPQTPPLQVTILVEASEHLIEVTKAIAALLAANPEWEANVA